MNKKIKKLFCKSLLIFSAMFICIFTGCSEERNTNTNTTTNKDVKITKETVKFAKIGEEIQAGNIGVKVLEAKEQNSISNEAGKSNASGKFIIVKLEIKNNGNEPTTYNPNEFKLLDKGKKYEVDENSFEALSNLNSQETIFKENKNFIDSYDKFNAGLIKNTYLVFDVPKESQINNLKLIVEGAKNTQLNLK